MPSLYPAAVLLYVAVMWAVRGLSPSLSRPHLFPCVACSARSTSPSAGSEAIATASDLKTAVVTL
jgi:hypothetical protein